MDFSEYDVLDELREYDPVKDDNKLNYSIPDEITPENEIQTLLGDFDYSIDRKADAQYYYENYPNFPLYMYPILQEVSTGIKPDRSQLRKIILKERKRMKKWRKQNDKINKAINELKNTQQGETEL